MPVAPWPDWQPVTIIPIATKHSAADNAGVSLLTHSRQQVS